MFEILHTLYGYVFNYKLGVRLFECDWGPLDVDIGKDSRLVHLDFLPKEPEWSVGVRTVP